MFWTLNYLQKANRRVQECVQRPFLCAANTGAQYENWLHAYTLGFMIAAMKSPRAPNTVPLPIYHAQKRG